MLASSAFGGQEKLPIWRVDGASNRIYILGSVHLLRPSDYPLPSGIYDAYADAETLIMELDMDDLDAVAAQALASELGIISTGGNLATLMGAESFKRASVLAAEASIPLELLAQTEPWLAAITIEQLMLTRIGFDPSFGVENHLMQKAAKDHKEILGLETMRDQLELLDQLPMDVQRELLMQTLEDGLELENQMDTMITAWISGDSETLERTMLDDMREHPALYDKIVVSRNRNWVGQIEALLDDYDDYLIVVGALHLVGEDGVPQMLARRGHPVRQLDEPATP
ncbi:MAG: TraB/GumN family protein [Halioglobus sp.]|nr:TraB/GumN family protein [Halioglobus sp.]